MLGPMDEYPVHQVPQPIAWPGLGPQLLRPSYFNAHDRTGDIFVITGIGYYPNLGPRTPSSAGPPRRYQTAVHLSDAIDQDRLNQHVGNYRVEVIEPPHNCGSSSTKTEGIAPTSPGRACSVVQEQPHVMRRATG